MSTQYEEKLILDTMKKYCDIISPEYPDVNEVKEVLTQLSDEQKLDILEQLHLYTITTPLHCAAYRNHPGIITTLLMSLQSEYRLPQLLMDKCSTPLHTASERGNIESVKVILDCLTADQQVQLMYVQCEGETAIQCAERRGLTYIATVLTEYEKSARKWHKKRQTKEKLSHHQTVDERKINNETSNLQTTGK